MIVNLANPRGFCAGVDRAIDIVKKAIEICKSKLKLKKLIAGWYSKNIE